jgi:hypothetical protein
VAEILSAPPSPEERRALRREQAEAEAKRASAADTADNAAAAAFMAQINGTPPRDVLAEAAAEMPFRDREAAARRRAAIDVLRPLGLADVVTGFQSGVVFDANMGVLEPVPDVAQRAAMDRQYVSGRSERQAEERREAVNRARGELLARRRARRLASRAAHVTNSDSVTSPTTYPAPDDDWERERAFRARMGGVYR